MGLLAKYRTKLVSPHETRADHSTSIPPVPEIVLGFGRHTARSSHRGFHPRAIAP